MTYRPSGLLLCSSFLSSLLVTGHTATARTTTATAQVEATPAAPTSTSTSTSTSTKTTIKSPVRKGAETVQVIPSTATHESEQVIVTAHLDRARSELSPTTGASVYHFSRQALENIPGGDNAPLNQVLLQAPGVAQDGFGQIHVRGDHNEVQFRLDGVQLPEGLSVFGQALMTRFANDMSLTTGALPSQFGFLQAAVVDITTKNGTTNPGGNLSIYGGARDYFFPSLQYGFHKGKWDFFATADYVHDRVGIENTTSSFNAPHDLSNQYHFLGHARYTADEDTRISLIAGISNAEYQLPNNPGQDWNHDYTPPANVTPSSNDLNEHQKQITDFAVLALQKEIGSFSLQNSVFTRYSSLRYSPDPTGDLYYFGNAQRAARSVFSTGTQHDVTWRAARDHTVRFGFQVFVERNTSKTISTVFPQTGVNGNGEPIYGTTPFDVHDGSGKTGMVYGLYAQDEWRPLRNLTINYGLRFDGVSEYTAEHQVSPRVNVVWKPWQGGTLHVGYSRYFTPPPFEVVSATSLSILNNTSGQANSLTNGKVRAERDHYFDAGFAQTILPGWHIAFDAYYKLAKNLIDEGQFGAPIILSGFNYRHGQVNGYEVSTSYDRGPLSLYGNFAWSRAIGKDINSAQFNFESKDISYASTHWVHLDHDQRWTASAGAAYTFFHKTRAPLRLSASMVYGSGLRADDEANDIPNGLALTPYATVNFSAVQTIRNTFGTTWAGDTQLRLDVINLGDHTYLLRDGSGIGVGAPQYGLRRTILCGISQGF